MKKISCYIGLVLSFLVACERESTCKMHSFQDANLPVMEYLIGAWQLDDLEHVEVWKKMDKNTYQSNVYSVKGLDSVLEETAKVYLKNNTWIFENQVINQNNGVPIAFKSVSNSSREIHFSNPTHDFPTEICYHLHSKSVLSAFIVGKNKNEKNDTIFFNYQRISKK